MADPAADELGAPGGAAGVDSPLQQVTVKAVARYPGAEAGQAWEVDAAVVDASRGPDGSRPNAVGLVTPRAHH